MTHNAVFVNAVPERSLNLSLTRTVAPVSAPRLGFLDAHLTSQRKECEWFPKKQKNKTPLCNGSSAFSQSHYSYCLY